MTKYTYGKGLVRWGQTKGSEVSNDLGGDRTVHSNRGHYVSVKKERVFFMTSVFRVGVTIKVEDE